jgi:hypothetical protein
MLTKLKLIFMPFGINPIKAILTLVRYPSFISDFIKFKKNTVGNSNEFPINSFFPCIHDKYEESGQANGHYFHQDLFVANRIFSVDPKDHFDVGSRIDGFVAHVASFRKIKVIDIRVLNINIENMKFIQADMMLKLPDALIESSDSISCLHTIEHFGLGRYGDPINSNGHIIGFNNLLTILKPEGILYFSTPIGPQRIEFNAHRVFSLSYLVNKMFKGFVTIKSFSYVDDNGNFHSYVDLNEEMINANFGCNYGCGIFELVKI